MKSINGMTGVVARLALAAGLLGTTALTAASAAPLGPRTALEADGALVTPVDNRERILGGIGAVIGIGATVCQARVAQCEERYEEGTRGYARCMRGCEWSDSVEAELEVGDDGDDDD